MPATGLLSVTVTSRRALPPSSVYSRLATSGAVVSMLKLYEIDCSACEGPSLCAESVSV